MSDPLSRFDCDLVIIVERSSAVAVAVCQALASQVPIVVVGHDRAACRAAARAGAGACLGLDDLTPACLDRAIEDAQDRWAARVDSSAGTVRVAGDRAGEAATRLWQRMEARMGMCPSFFTLAGHAPSVVTALYEFTEQAFLDNPIPIDIKEQLFIYLSRFCPVAYCLARHCAFLLERERGATGSIDASNALALLSEPLPDPDALADSLAELERAGRSGEQEWPEWSSSLGYAMRVGCAQLLLDSHRAGRWSRALLRVLGPTAHTQLLLFVAFVHVAHFWTEIHPEIEFEADLRGLLSEQPELAEAIGAVVGSAVRRSEVEQRDHAEITELRGRLEQTQRLRLLADALPAYVSYIDADRRYVFLNRYYSEQFGRPASELVGERVADVLGPSNYARICADLDRALGGELVRLEQSIELPHGGLRHVDAAYAPDRRPDGSVAGCFVLVTDITERKQAEDLTRRVLDNLFTFVAILDLDGTLIESNAAPLEAAGITLEDVRGRKFWDTYWFADSPGIQAQLRDAWARAIDGERVRFDVPTRIADGARIIVDFQLAPLRDKSGAITHLIPSAVDVTHRVRVEQRLRESEDRSRLAQAAGKVGVWEYDSSSGETFWSDVMWDIYGRAPAPGVNPRELFRTYAHPEDVEHLEVAANGDEHLLPGVGHRELFRIIRPDRGVRWIKAITTVSPTGDGHRVVGVNIDVTALKQAEEVLRGSEERLRLAQDAAGLGIHDYDIRAGTLSWDARVRELWGVGPDERVTPEMFLAGVHPEDREQVAAGIHQAFEPSSDGLFQMEHRVIRRDDGQLRWVAVTGRTSFEGDEAVRSVGTVCDITSHKRAETALRRSKQLLRESDRRKDEFLAMLGHELRNPLAAIRSASELLRLYTNEDPRLQRLGDVLDRQSHHMVRLVDGLLEVSRIAQGKIHLEWKAVDLTEVLLAVLDDRRDQLAASGLELEVSLPGEGLWVAGDEVRLAQVFDNLLGNALKFTAAPGQVRVHAQVLGPSMRVTIADTGVGVHAEMLDVIFEPFAQVDHEIARINGGLGIGLALVRALVELHGGEVLARSEGPGRGAEFEVRIPADNARRDGVP